MKLFLHADSRTLFLENGLCAESHPRLTLCESVERAAAEGVRRRKEIPEGSVHVGFYERGQVRLLREAYPDVQGVWRRRLDRRELASVQLDKESDERRDFRRALISGDRATANRLGPGRNFRW